MCAVHWSLTRVCITVLRLVRGVIGALVVDGKVIRPPTPYALLGAAERALLGSGKIWEACASAVARRASRPMGGELVAVSAWKGQWIVDGLNENARLRVMALLPLDPGERDIHVWLHVPALDGDAVTQLHCCGDVRLSIAPPPPLECAAREGWLCYDVRDELIGVDVDPAFDALWALRCLAAAKHVSVDKAKVTSCVYACVALVRVEFR